MDYNLGLFLFYMAVWAVVFIIAVRLAITSKVRFKPISRIIHSDETIDIKAKY
mgnify:FL=1